jgi:hypothetical protein
MRHLAGQCVLGTQWVLEAFPFGLQNSGGGRRAEAWDNNNSASLGKKSHGETNALRMLLSKVGVMAARSAPANLSASLSESLEQPLDQPLDRSLTMSSGTESAMRSLASGSFSSGQRSVRRIPIVEDSPTGTLTPTWNLLTQGICLINLTVPQMALSLFIDGTRFYDS